MGKVSEKLSKEQVSFIKEQHLFFVGTSSANASINVSPKGMDSLRVISEKEIIWLNFTGSGNETGAHIQENGKMTLMFCSFNQKPLILRTYGKAEEILAGSKQWDDLKAHFGSFNGGRQIFRLKINKVQSSCGFGVPLFEYQGERETLNKWSEKKGEEGIRDYWKEKNTLSLDGKNIKIPD